MRRGLITLAAGTAALAAYNRKVTIPRDKVEEQLPTTPEMWHWRFGDVAVYKRGDESNVPMLLLHGHNAAASAAEMRHPFEALSERYHVYAPDLLGYGLSDRPDVDYTPGLYINLIESLLREVIGRPAVVVASSLSAAYAIEVANSSPEWVRQLVLVCPTGVRRLNDQSSGGKVAQTILSLPVIGQGLFNGIASRRSIRYFLEQQTYYDKSLVTDELVEQYYRTAHAPGARYAPSAFVAGKLYHDARDAWTNLEQGVLLVWGREAKITPVSDAAAFLATNPRAELQEIIHASLLPHDEQPEQFAHIVLEWLDLQPRF
jgi:pimeloyl-ACP methyl ester carboxylesterase